MSATLLILFSTIICYIWSFAIAIKILLFDKNCYIRILIKRSHFYHKQKLFYTTFSCARYCSDGQHTRSLVLSVKNFVNDLYCKDISEKVKSALIIKKEKGIYANGSCIFGYCKDPNNRHALLIVEEEAAVVKRIFQMTMEGISSHKIAQQFHMEGIRTPIEYKIERGAAIRIPKDQRFTWNASTICHMLRNATYAGDMVYGKYETPEVSGRPRLKPRSEWKVFRNHHEMKIA